MMRIKKSLFPKELTDQQDQVLTGLLLGDAYLSRQTSKQSNTHLAITRTASDKNYNIWLSEIFFNMLTPKSISDRSVYDKRTNKTYYHSDFRTKTCVVLNNYQNLWYPNGVKHVPTDIKLTPLSIAIWFCDDGCVLQRPYNKLATRFATNSYTLKEVEILVDLLNQTYNVSFHPSKAKNDQYVIDGADVCTRAIISDIQNLIPESMKRKIKW